ncbi:hypothetical protein JCM10207_007823 [Rhodosporidiobolus poonsookiae]
MPVPSLPLELVGLILTELRTSCGDDDKAKRSNGLAAALVCKAWQLLGVAVVWHKIELHSPGEVRRFVRRAETFPHFPPLVKEMAFGSTPERNDDSNNLDDVDDVDDLDDLDDADFDDLFTSCTNLEVLSAPLVRWMDPHTLALALPRLKRVKHLHVSGLDLDGPHVLDILPQLATLPRLAHLRTTVLLYDNKWILARHAIAPLQLRRLEVASGIHRGGGAEPDGTMPFYRPLFDHIDTSTLELLSLKLYPTDVGVVDRIFGFRNLRVLVLSLYSVEEVTPFLERTF